MAIKLYYHYDPSLAAAAVFAALFGITTILHLYQMTRTRTWYFIPFCVGGIFEVIGFAFRAVNANQTPNWAFPPFVIQTLGILLAPVFFAASIYMELGRIMLLVDGESRSIIKRKYLTPLFVCGDILSFAVQAVGGVMITKQDKDTMNKGKKVVLIGLYLQIVFFGFFIFNSLLFFYCLRRSPTSLSKNMPWRKHMGALLAASALILGRCIYRVIEYTQGPSGELMDHEIYLYVLDAGFMLIVMLVFHFLHPSEVRSLRKGGKVVSLFKVYSVQGQDDSVLLTSRDGDSRRGLNSV